MQISEVCGLVRCGRGGVEVGCGLVRRCHHGVSGRGGQPRSREEGMDKAWYTRV